MRFNLARELQDNKKFYVFCSYLVERPKEHSDKYIQRKGISR